MNNSSKKILLLLLGFGGFLSAVSYATLSGVHSLPPPVRAKLKQAQHNKWTPDEDQLLRELVEQYETKDWPVIAFFMASRTARQCHDRWNIYLAPDSSHDPWTRTEDALLLQKLQELGPRWAEIRQFFSRRTNRDCRNRWVTLMRKAARAQQENPVQPPSQISPPSPDPNPQDDISTQNDDDSPPPMAQPPSLPNPQDQVPPQLQATDNPPPNNSDHEPEIEPDDEQEYDPVYWI